MTPLGGCQFDTGRVEGWERWGRYGTRPMAARTEGRERMPREIVSAIMTVEVRFALMGKGGWEGVSRGRTHAGLPVTVG